MGMAGDFHPEPACSSLGNRIQLAYNRGQDAFKREQEDSLQLGRGVKQVTHQDSRREGGILSKEGLIVTDRA